MADEAAAMPHVWSVSELTSALKGVLSERFPSVDLEGEVSGFKVYPGSGHAYFTLKDENAQIAAVMFKGRFATCPCREAIKDGVKLKVRGSISVGLRSQYQIVVSRARLLGEGELMQRFLELRAKLSAEGLFDPSRKRRLPYLPKRVGLVTSPSGAVVHDMCRVLMRRFPNLEIRLFPAAVQGDAAAASVASGLAYFNGLVDWRADVIIFGRGGGSFEDLFCFNDEALVRAVAASGIPTVSAVGHETDFTLCDFAADVRAGTPSMAAELVVPELLLLERKLKTASSSLTASLRGKYQWYAQRVDGLADDLVGALQQQAADRRSELDDLRGRLSLLCAGLTSSRLLAARRIDGLSEKMAAALRLCCSQAASRLDALAGKLSVLSPFSVLERGYSLTTDAAGRVLRDADGVPDGTLIRTRLQKGELVSRTCRADGSGERNP